MIEPCVKIIAANKNKGPAFAWKHGNIVPSVWRLRKKSLQNSKMAASKRACDQYLRDLEEYKRLSKLLALHQETGTDQ